MNSSNSNPVVRVRLSLSASRAPKSLSIIKYVKKLVLSVRYVNTTTYPINPIISGAEISLPDAICSSDSILTLDIPATSEPKSIVRLLTNAKFTVVYSLPVANIMNMKGNIVVKIDDTDFEATNPGVWCWSVRDLINEDHFTDWREYKGDEIV